MIRSVKQYILGSVFIILVGLAWIFPLLGYFIPLCMIAGVGLASLQGRKWCDWYCPRGSFADAFMKHFSPEKSIPRAMRTAPLRLVVLSFLMAMLTFQIFRLWPDFYAIGHFFVILLTITSIAGIIFAWAIHQRSWCYICPIGFLSSIVGKNRKPLQMNKEVCVGCKLCNKVCPMQLAPSSLKESPRLENQGDCLKCELCVASCPKSALSFEAGLMNPGVNVMGDSSAPSKRDGSAWGSRPHCKSE